jgi:hypothetical protein
LIDGEDRLQGSMDPLDEGERDQPAGDGGRAHHDGNREVCREADMERLRAADSRRRGADRRLDR